MASNTHILIREDEWGSMGDPGDGYEALYYEGPPFSINGIHMHLTAIPVVTRAVVDDGEVYEIQEGAPGWQDEYEGLARLDPEGMFQTHRIRGQEYVLVMTPYQD